MRDIFKWDRTTENFFRYVSTKTFSETLGSSALYQREDKHFVVYIPRHGRDHPPYLQEEMIVSRMSTRDLDLKPYGEPVCEPILRPIKDSQLVRYPQALRQLGPPQDRFATLSEHRELERKVADLNSKKVNTSYFLDWMGRLENRIVDLEFAQGILFKAVYWILRKLRAVK